MIKSISIIYPVYNEETRLDRVFSDINKFDLNHKYIKKEYIFVNDGSTDKSLSLIKKKIKKNKKIKVISYKKNMGKGYALKQGVNKAKSNWILTSDSDCSVSNFQLISWIKKKYINRNCNIYFGSRNHYSSVVKKKVERKIIGIIFKIIIKFLFKITLSDTQCGFKLYKSKTAKKLFKGIVTNGYMHDIEICLIAKRMKLKIHDLPVNWMHRKNGKINFFKDFFLIMHNLLSIARHRY